MERGEDVELDVAALQLAKIEFPELDVSSFREILDSHARELGAMLARTASGEEYVRAANEYFFQSLGFHGNQEDYYNAHNSCLNEVLVTRTGIPITLGVVYMEVSRRLGRKVEGLGMPGHFLVRYTGEDYMAVIDCFHGKILDAEEGRAVAPSSKYQIIVRMLNNLRQVYFRKQDFERSIRVLDLLIEAMPDSAEERKQRGVIQLHLKHAGAALQDLQEYLRLAPEAPDRATIEGYVEDLRRYLRSMN